MSRVRVAAVQYFMRKVQSYQDFVDQVSGLVETAAGYRCDMVVFPEYFTLQLLTLKDTRRPVPAQVRDLARDAPRFIETMGGLAKEHGIYIVAGTTPVLAADDETLTNESFFFSPSGEHAVQGKMHMTRWETEEWGVTPHDSLKVFDTAFGKVAVLICYDVEFPELAREAARRGAYIIVAPSCTDDRNGFLRVRYCAHARCVENQLYVIHTGTVGSLPQIPAISLNYGQAGILTPCDYPFARDGILSEGVANQESMVIGDLDLGLVEQSRINGSVLPLRDSLRSREVAERCEVVPLPK
ncbi:MAG: carbon-nitrogen hydrolase family protein [Sandaracinaceae bacterium]|nr:MAG: acyltransferase [Sandaracinaceae bacterium]HBQ15591.1 acyltransferase [Myxococcales bacterium]